MQSLVTAINSINQELIVGIKDTYKYFGLCKEVIRGTEKQNFDINTQSQVVIDDSFKSFFYHKVKDVSFKVIQQRGKGHTYNYNYSVDLICYSELIDFEEHIINRLSNANVSKTEIIINNIDFDSYKIIANETGRKDFDFNKYLFVVNYQILKKADNCNETCL